MTPEEYGRKVDTTAYICASLGAILGLVFLLKSAKKSERNVGRMKKIIDTFDSAPDYFSIPGKNLVVELQYISDKSRGN